MGTLLNLFNEATPSQFPRLRGRSWADVRKIGSIERDVRGNGSVRVRLRFPDPWNTGKRLRLPERPLPGGEWVAFDDSHAEEDLAQIRNALLAGVPLKKALKPWLHRIDDGDLIENRAKRWLEDFELAVQSEDRSEGTLREYRRYARTFFGWWAGSSILTITRRDVKDWHQWLATNFSISGATRKKISDAFRVMLREAARDSDGEINVPVFPVIPTSPEPRRVMPIEDRTAAIGQIPWEHRGAFMVAASECLRVSELRAYTLDDYESAGKLRIQASIQGSGSKQRRVRHNKNRSAEWRTLWDAETISWLEWRLAQATPESRLRGEVALFWHPSARNTEKRWSTDPFRKAWVQACEDAGVPFVSFQQATRHTTLSQLAKVLPERMLQAHSRHRDKRSLDPYVLSSPQPEAIVQAMRPHGSAPNQPPGDKSEESSR